MLHLSCLKFIEGKKPKKPNKACIYRSCLNFLIFSKKFRTPPLLPANKKQAERELCLHRGRGKRRMAILNRISIKLFFLPLFLISCVHTEEKTNHRIFSAPKEKVWEVLVETLKSYPLKTIDEQQSYIETEALSGDRFWKAPHQKQKDFSGYSSVISLRLNYTPPLSRVFINKKVYKQKGFISSKKQIPSDFLEETVLLYQIARELKVRSKLRQQ